MSQKRLLALVGAVAIVASACGGTTTTPAPASVAPGDLGRVIGRRGRTAQSIRTLVRAAANRDGVEVDIEFLD